MRINHNIASLNTYRQLSMNTLNGSKSLEKLSSGLRINRAGDDAAGLAISEKMRAQIRGLDQAARNAQDGISMIQTAEGALAETHSILQRMRELANQAANDTNVGVDRGEIQKEINQLSSEINRIGNTTEFNTQKLLDGGRQVKVNAVLSGDRLTGGQGAITHNVANLTHVNGDPATAASQTGGQSIAQATNISTLDDVATFAITIDGTTFTVTGAQLKAGQATNWNGTGTAENMVSWLSENMMNDANNIGSVATLSVESGSLKITTNSEDGTASTISIAFTGTTGDTALMRTLTGIEEAQEAQVSGLDATAAYSQFQFTDNPTEGASLTLYGTNEKIVFYDSTNAQWTGMTTDEIKQSLGADYLVQIGADAATTVANLVSISTQVADFTITQNPEGLGNTYVRFTYGATGQQHGNMVTIGNNGLASAARGYLTFNDTPTEGSSITIGGQKISFYDSSLENYRNDMTAKAGLGADFVVDIKDKNLQQVVDEIVKLNASINTAASREVSLSRENRADGSVRLNVAAKSTGFAGNLIDIAKSADTTQGFKATLQVGANTGQSIQIDVTDMRAYALKITGIDGNNLEVKAKNGSIAYYTSVANVSNGTDSAAIEYALDVSSHKKATAAVSVINDAIEAVSAQRSQLGAYQNRLEHTINNLGTSSENLTASESRIRDVDMAKEMMEFTKNNILSQAAQAMLAQANQQPQGVLQLLR